MDYQGAIFRPPSEAHSLLLQVTIGCSHNRCSYCSMYRDKSFRAKDFELVEKDLEEAAAYGPQFDKVFLCDGDALILSGKRLLRILDGVRKYLPWVKRVGTYGDTRSVKKKSAAELKELRDAGLAIVYHGMESGDDEVLRYIDKGGTQKEAIEMAQKLRDAGITHSVMVLLGVGGAIFSQQHARNTAVALSEMDPGFAAALTTTVVPGTPLAQQEAAGDFSLPPKFALLEELRTIVVESNFSNCRFSANHASNYLPVRANLPEQKDSLVELIDEVLKTQDESRLKPEYLRGL